jgi:GTP-binding protein
MRFIDEARIRIIGGHGGPGCVSFRRETFIPRGGPDGGDGGDGGDVIFVSSAQLGTLQDFRYRREYRAPSGEHGSGSNKAGKDGENIVIRVPVGTIIRDAETGETLVDFTRDRQEWLAAEGGRGGKGNAHFVSSTFQAPKFAQDGEEGGSRELLLELKLLADAAIIGFPNAGKSTLTSRISAARPKIADYPFTTLTPNLGVVSLGDGASFVVADIPGLIEGAHRGHGLGHKFLKHIERTRLFVHLLDGARLLEEGPEELIRRYRALREELGHFNPELLRKPELVVLNKLDVLASESDALRKARADLRREIASIRGTEPAADEPYVISAVAGTGIPELLGVLDREIRAERVPSPASATRLPDAEDIRR